MRIKRLQENLHFINDSDNHRQHRIFVDSRDMLKDFDVCKHLDTSSEIIGRAYNRPRNNKIDNLTSDSCTIPAPKVLSDILLKQSKLYKELNSRKKRASKLQSVMSNLALQRNLMGKGSKKKSKLSLDSDSKRSIEQSETSKENVVYKWKRERLR